MSGSKKELSTAEKSILEKRSEPWGPHPSECLPPQGQGTDGSAQASSGGCGGTEVRVLDSTLVGHGHDEHNAQSSPYVEIHSNPYRVGGGGTGSAPQDVQDKVKEVDREIEALKMIACTLQSFDRATQRRIIGWASSRYGS